MISMVHCLKDEGAGGHHSNLNENKYIYSLQTYWSHMYGGEVRFLRKKGKRETSCKTEQGLAPISRRTLRDSRHVCLPEILL